MLQEGGGIKVLKNSDEVKSSQHLAIILFQLRWMVAEYLLSARYGKRTRQLKIKRELNIF